MSVLVTVAGEPHGGATVLQGGSTVHATTGADGRGSVRVDPSQPGETWVVAALPGHRSDGVELLDAWPEEPIRIDLAPVPTDNPDYPWGAPGAEGGESSEFCAHCHPTLTGQFARSAHRGSASNPAVLALAKGGDGCGDCHAPGFAGDLHAADGVDRSDGVHCDFCHKVADVRLDQPPGSRFVLGRPTDGPGVLSEFKAAMYGPYPDVLNPFMGGVYSPLHREARFCAACHEFSVGDVPVMTTYSEFLATPFAAAGGTCNDCHMPATSIPNAADLDTQYSEPGVAAGFARASGEVRDHSFYGALRPLVMPVRTGRADRGTPLIQGAVALEVSAAIEDGRVVVTATSTVTGAGHAVPTGEPLRQLVLTTNVSGCGGPMERLSGGRTVFARVLVDADGNEAHHGSAVAEASDTRLLPGAPRVDRSEYAAAPDCPDLVATAQLTYWRFPMRFALGRGGGFGDNPVVVVSASAPVVAP